MADSLKPEDANSQAQTSIRYRKVSQWPLSQEEALIRDFRKSDLDGILDLLPKCFAEEFEVSGFDSDHIRDMVNRAFGLGGRILLAPSRLFGTLPFRFLVAVRGDELVGSTMVSGAGKAGYISSVMVAPDLRRRGLATKLVTTAVEYIQGRGEERAVLHVVTTNMPAIGVYSKLGFEEFERVARLVASLDSEPSEEPTSNVVIRPYRSGDLEEVYNLHMVSEDPSHIAVFGFDRKELKTPLWLRLFRFVTRARIVAVRGGSIIGSVEVQYSSPKEAGHISSLLVRAEDRSGSVEKALAAAAMREIWKGGVRKVVAQVPATRPELNDTMQALGYKEAKVLAGMSRALGGR